MSPQSSRMASSAAAIGPTQDQATAIRRGAQARRARSVQCTGSWCRKLQPDSQVARAAQATVSVTATSG